MRIILWISLLFCTFLAGYFRMKATVRAWEQTEAQLPAQESQVQISGCVSDIREKETYYLVTADTERFEKVLIYLEKERFPEADFPIGSEIAAWGRVSRFSKARNPGEFDRRQYYASRQISMALFAEIVFGRGDGAPYPDWLYRIRRHFSRTLQTLCDPEDAGIFQAALLGEREGLDPELQELYQRNGIAHLLAVSGLHFSLVGMGCYRLLRKAGLGYGISGLASGGMIASYAWMTGASGSAMRAAVMLFAAFLAEYLGRTYDLLSALSLAALLLSASQPLLLWSGGFWLSFGAVLGIGLLGEQLVKGLEVKRNWEKTVIISLSVQLLTGPIVLWQNFEYPLYGIFLNLIVVPLMGYVLLSGLLAIGLGSWFPAPGIAALGCGHYILEGYEKLCRMVSGWPGQPVVWGRPEIWQLGGYYLLLAAAAAGICLPNPSSSLKETNRFRRIWRKWALLAAGTAGGIFFLLPKAQKGCDVAFLDVGQGDGIVIRCDGGAPEHAGRAVILVDGGSSSERQVGKNRLEPYLKSAGISHVDVAFVSHGDQDHISGLLYLLEESSIQVDCLVLPEAGMEDAGYDDLILAAENRRTRVCYMHAGEQVQVGNCRFTCLYPEKGEEIDPADRNQQSLVLRMDYEEFHLLLTGDVGQEGEEKIRERTPETELRPIQVLKAAHHGSRFSTSEELLEAVRPQLAVISYGEANSYGHPHEETLERLKEAGCQVLKTGELGAVLMHVEDGALSYGGYCRRENGSRIFVVVKRQVISYNL